MINRAAAITASLLVAMGIACSAQANPVFVADQAAGLLGSPVAELQRQDPLLQQAINWFRLQQVNRSEHKFRHAPDTTIGRQHVDIDGALILGGTEALPM
jgi:hypothetical protein